MTAEVAILRAYAFATQGKYAEAEQLLVSAPEALNTPSGADLLARIKFEQGDEVAARRIWKRLLADDSTNESAKNALAALDASPCEVVVDDEVGPCFCRRWKFAIAGILAVLLGLAFSLGKSWNDAKSGSLNEPAQLSCQHPRVIAEQTLEISKINGKVLAELRDGILTNMIEGAVLVLSGGKGRYVTDRQRQLSIIAENIRQITGVRMNDILISVAEDSQEYVNIAIVPRIISAPKKGEGYAD